MSYHRTRAIILRKTDYSNTSVVLNALTQESGRLGLIAKGVRRGGAAYETEPELFTIHDVVFTLRRNGVMGTLTESAVIDDMHGIRRKVDRFWAASYMAELLLDLTAEGQPLTEVYALAAGAFRGIARAQKVAPHVFIFEMGLLRLLGHEPSMAACVECGSPRKRAGAVAFSALKGGYLCKDCRRTDPNAITIRGSAAALMQALGKSAQSSRRADGAAPARADRLNIDRDSARDLRRALNHFFTFLRERPSKTLKYMQALYR
ncbi:MAG: DNA repair protein RecO [Planctomycetota bacterium]|nr:MAG: DNA repair protein RecO [Planctomycetota bacterium]